MRRPHVSYANVTSSLALFLIPGGGAYAAVGSIPGADDIIHGCYLRLCFDRVSFIITRLVGESDRLSVP